VKADNVTNETCELIRQGNHENKQFLDCTLTVEMYTDNERIRRVKNMGIKSEGRRVGYLEDMTKLLQMYVTE
jgi:hypothetical protein